MDLHLDADAFVPRCCSSALWGAASTCVRSSNNEEDVDVGSSKRTASSWLAVVIDILENMHSSFLFSCNCSSVRREIFVSLMLAKDMAVVLVVCSRLKNVAKEGLFQSEK